MICICRDHRHYLIDRNNQMYKKKKKRQIDLAKLLSFTETSELKRYVGMKAEIGAAYDYCIARSISNQPVTLIQGEHTRTAGCVNRVRRAMQIHEI